MSKHLKRIVRHAQENKMTIRNGITTFIYFTDELVGIVFSPTLNIPAPVFSLFITEYEVVFDEPDDTPVTDTIPPPYTTYNNTHDSSLVSHSNHLNVQESTSHHRYHSPDPPHRGAPPPSFPQQNQGYQESVYRPQAHQQQSYQQSYENKPNRPFVNTQKSSYHHAKWDSREESTGLFD
jgi:RalA-binding protein 1